jgi:hypothetical protein
MVAVAEGVESPAQDIAPAIDRLADPPPWAGPHVVEPLPAESEPRRRRVRRS